MKLIYLIITFSTIFYIGCGSSRSYTDTKIVKKLKVPKNKEIYFGAYADFGYSESDVTTKKIKDFENLAGKKLAWVYMTNSWKDGIVYPKKKIHTIVKSGSTPFIRFLPRSDDGKNETTADKLYTLQNIIDGKFDEELKKWAKDAMSDDIPILMDFGLEMTGFWFPWCGFYNGGGELAGYGDASYPDGPERFRDAYRHIINLFRTEGVKHVTWFFHPDIQRLPDKEWNSAKYYYPGDEYIDWIGLSVYGVQRDNAPWIYFSKALERRHMLIDEITDKKPIALLEFAVTDNHAGGSKSAWLEDAFSSILYNPYFDFKAISYWHENWINPVGQKSTLRIDSSKESLETFKRLIQDNHFISKTSFANY
jgi:hypothetical protein